MATSTTNVFFFIFITSFCLSADLSAILLTGNCMSEETEVVSSSLRTPEILFAVTAQVMMS